MNACIDYWRHRQNCWQRQGWQSIETTARVLPYNINIVETTMHAMSMII